jgi:hypothetical protein
MAHWGIAVTYYHQLWEPPINETSYAKGIAELALVTSNLKRPELESGFIDALAAVHSNGDRQLLRERMLTLVRTLVWPRSPGRNGASGKKPLLSTLRREHLRK